jgi:O-methyltransferase
VTDQAAMTPSIANATRSTFATPGSPDYAYLLRHEPPEHEVMSALRTVTGAMPNGHMQIGPDQAHMMAFLVKLMGARRILEIGTFTGYSALAMALALPADGQLITCDVDENWTEIGRRFWEAAGVASKIEQRIGPATDILDELERAGAGGSFDIVFVDANKPDYDRYYESSLRLARTGGLIILDNMMFLGRVADLHDRSSAATTLRELNAKIAQDERVDRVILPIGDGVTFARRR